MGVAFKVLAPTKGNDIIWLEGTFGVIAYSIVAQGNIHKYIKVYSKYWVSWFGFVFICTTHLWILPHIYFSMWSNFHLCFFRVNLYPTTALTVWWNGLEHWTRPFSTHQMNYSVIYHFYVLQARHTCVLFSISFAHMLVGVWLVRLLQLLELEVMSEREKVYYIFWGSCVISGDAPLKPREGFHVIKDLSSSFSPISLCVSFCIIF